MYPSHWAETDPDAPAIIEADSGEVITFSQLADRSARLANFLRASGVGPGGHVAVMMVNSVRYLEIIWGCLLSGAHVTPVTRYATAEDVSYIVADSGATVLITDATSAATIAGARAARAGLVVLAVSESVSGCELLDDALARSSSTPIDPGEPMGEYMFYSSGTTGRPKGVERPSSGRTIAAGSLANRMLERLFRFGQGDVYLNPAPLYHGAPLGFSIAAVSLGGTVVTMRKFDAAKALAAIGTYRVTHSQWVPTMFTRMLLLDDSERAAADVSSQRVVIHSAAPCPRHVKEAMMDWWGPILHEYYSGTEDVGITYASPEDWLAHPGTVGKPLGFAIHICDDQGREVPAGVDGLVYFETRSGRTSYRGDDEKTRKAQHPTHPRWVTLDDVGHLDEDGFLYLTDRASFMIISGGVNVYPQEIEDTLLLHPAIADVAVIGVPSEDMGEDIKAIVEVRRGVNPSAELAQEIVDFARGRLAGPKRPRSVDFVDSMPRLPTGKLAKKQIRAPYWAGV